MIQILEQLLLKLTTSLSDRCKVEIKWAGLLEAKRLDISKREYVDLSPEEQKRLARVYRCYCWAHCLSGMTRSG